MTAIRELESEQVSREDYAALEGFVATLEPSGLREFLGELADMVRSGQDASLLASDVELSPQQAADVLKMSRTHLYKLLDEGLIMSHRIGRDRRIRLTDLRNFERARDRDRRELAERFAHADQTRAGAAEELLADL